MSRKHVIAAIVGALGLLPAVVHAAGSSKAKELHNEDGDFVFIPRDELPDVESNNAGIGVRLVESSGAFVVAGAFDSGPAAKAGIRSGDAVVSVDGRKTAGASLETVVSWLRGRAGTLVVLKVKRSGGKTEKVSLIRSEISTFTSPQPPSASMKFVALKALGEKSCPKSYEGCHFLAAESEQCVYTCRR